MIFKDTPHHSDKRVKPLTGMLLFMVSVVLFILTAPLGLVIGFFYGLYKNGLRGLGEYCLKIAISIDQLGNVVMQHVLNLIWLKKGAYKFGNRDETISSALGRNKKLGLLSGFGKIIDKVLDVIDPDHSLNSIDYYIEPTQQIVDKLAWIYIKDGRILSTRARNKAKYYLPGGKRDLGENNLQALSRVIRKELSIDLFTDTMLQVGIFEAQADGHGPEILVRMTCYEAEFIGTINPASEIEEMVWLNYSDRGMVSQVDKKIFDFLKAKKQLF